MSSNETTEPGPGRPRKYASAAKRVAAYRERNREMLREKQRVRREEDRLARIAAGTRRPVGRPPSHEAEAEQAEISRRERRVTQYAFRDWYLEDARMWREEHPEQVAKMAKDWAQQVKKTAAAILREFAATPEAERQALALELLDAEHRVITAAIRYSSVDKLVGGYAGV
ncbi:MAG: hypothetical protein ABWY78_12360 [Microvirga sp.]